MLCIIDHNGTPSYNINMSRTRKNIIEYRSYELPVNFPVMLLSGEKWHISDVKSGKLHFHNCMEIGICHTDRGFMEFDGKPVEFTAGDVTIISRNIPHTTYSAQGTASLWSYIYVEPDGILAGNFNEASSHAKLFRDMVQNIHCILHPQDQPDIAFLANEIKKEMEERQTNFRESVRGLFLTFFMKLMRVYQLSLMEESHEPQEVAERENRLVISPALDYIRSNYMDNFPIEKLSDLCHMSPTHFRRLFHEIMLTSPLNYLNTTRVLESCALLRSSEESVLCISEQVGFRSVSSYNRHFQEVMGTNPSEWRKRFGKDAGTSILSYTGWTEAQKL